MCALFQSRAPDPLPPLEPATSEFPKIEGAEIAATTYGKRVAGDFYDSLRVEPGAGLVWPARRCRAARDQSDESSQPRQNMFRTLGTELFSRPDFNEVRRHDRTLSSPQPRRDGSRRTASAPAPHSSAATTRNSALSVTPMPDTRRGCSATAPALSNSLHRFAARPVLPRHLRSSHGWPGERRGSSSGFAGSG